MSPSYLSSTRGPLHKTIHDRLLVNGIVDFNCQTQRFGINVPNVHTTLVVEEDLIEISVALYANVNLLLIFVRCDWLDDEMIEDTNGLVKSDFFLHPFLDPFTYLIICLVHVDQTMLSTPFHQLVRLGAFRKN